eukprot:TRINITY_DN2404_c0_g1_i7.p1 TRINITY_DN2404_c0_g1~~TRINITY_DN2404_c0_g1_i7.p1  ORF type:complete len:1263 (+),score=71.99 TRINITY_DN2404_c0_g1_i7:160-3789(+)
MPEANNYQKQHDLCRNRLKDGNRKPRLRLNKRRRRMRQISETLDEFEYSCALTASVKRRLGRQADASSAYEKERETCLSHLRQSFRTCYFFFRDRDLTTACGPACPYNSGHIWFLLCWAMSRPFCVDWTRALRYKRKNLDECYSWLLRLLSVKDRFRKMKGSGSLRAYLRSHDLPTAPRFVLQHTCEHNKGSVRCWFLTVLAKTRKYAPFLADYVRDRTTVLAWHGKQWRDELINIQRFCRTFDVHELDSQAETLPPNLFQLASQGADLIRFPISLKTQRRISAEEKMSSQEEFCCEWLRATRLAGRIEVKPLKRNEWSDDHPSCPGGDWESLDHCFQQVRQAQHDYNLVMTCEDKDPNIGWLSVPLFFYIRWRTILHAGQQRWGICNADPSAVCSWYSHILLACLPANVRKKVGRMTIEQLPFVYATYKRKCFQGISTVSSFCLCPRTCEKAGHSCCMRNIVSFSPLPQGVRDAFKHVSRVVQTMIDSVWLSWSIGPMRDAFQTCSSRFAKQYPRHDLVNNKRCTCLHCNGKIDTVSVVVVDAGQAFEAVDVGETVEAVRHLNEAFKAKHGDATVSSVFGKRCNTFLGGNTKDTQASSVCIWSDTACRCVVLALLLRLFRFGSKAFICQKKGLPIGSPLSPTTLEVLFSWMEHRFDKETWDRISARHRLPGERENWISCMRYIDDLMLASSWFCNDCLKKFVTMTFQPHVSFDGSETVWTCGRNTVATFLDIVFVFSPTGVRLMYTDKNELGLWSPSSNKPGKSRYTRNNFSDQQARRRIAADLTGKVARWSQIGLTLGQCTYGIALEFCALLSLGYHTTILSAAWRSCRWYAWKISNRLHKAGTKMLRKIGNNVSRTPIHSDAVLVQNFVGENVSSRLASLRHSCSVYHCADPTMPKPNNNRWRQWNNAPYSQQGSTGGSTGGSANPMLKMARDFEETMGGLQAFGQMARWSNLLAANGQEQQQGQPNQVPWLKPKEATSAAAQQPSSSTTPAAFAQKTTHDLTEVLTDVLKTVKEGTGRPDPIPSQGTLLAKELAGDIDTLLAGSKAFQDMNRRMGTVETDTAVQKVELLEIKNTQSSHTQHLKEILDAVRQGPARRADPVDVDDDDEDDEDAEPGPVETISHDLHKKFCTKAGVTHTRVTLPEWTGDGAAPWNTWLQKISACKSHSQWRTKMTKVGVDKVIVDDTKSSQAAIFALWTFWAADLAA